MRRDENLSHYESCLLDLYERDPGVTYDLTQDELLTLLGLVGEEDSVVDAILKNSAPLSRRSSSSRPALRYDGHCGGGSRRGPIPRRQVRLGPLAGREEDGHTHVRPGAGREGRCQ